MTCQQLSQMPHLQTQMGTIRSKLDHLRKQIWVRLSPVKLAQTIFQTKTPMMNQLQKLR